MKEDKSQYWQDLISHINQSWKKKKGFGYPFQGKDFKNLKRATGTFMEWQLMALFDVFMDSDSDWIKNAGHSISVFLSCLPWLVDDPNWKRHAREYELKIAPIDLDVLKVIKNDRP